MLKDFRLHLCKHNSTVNYMVRSVLSPAHLDTEWQNLVSCVTYICNSKKPLHVYVCVCVCVKHLLICPWPFTCLWSPDCVSLFWLHLFEHTPCNHAHKYMALKRQAAIFIMALTKCIWNHSDFHWAEPSVLTQYQSGDETLCIKASGLTMLIILIKQQIECVG